MPAELAPEGAWNAETVTHGNPPCQSDIPVAQVRILMKSECCLLKQNPDPLSCQFLEFGIDCPLGHVSLLPYWYLVLY